MRFHEQAICDHCRTAGTPWKLGARTLPPQGWILLEVVGRAGRGRMLYCGKRCAVEALDLGEPFTGGPRAGRAVRA